MHAEIYNYCKQYGMAELFWYNKYFFASSSTKSENYLTFKEIHDFKGDFFYTAFLGGHVLVALEGQLSSCGEPVFKPFSHKGSYW